MSGRGPLRGAAIAIAFAAATATACGDAESTGLSETERTASPALTQAPATTGTSAATGTAEATVSPPGSTVPAPTTGEDERPGSQTTGGFQAPEGQEGGGGDEAAAASIVSLAIDDGAVTPRTTRVPPFLAIGLRVRSGDDVDRRLRVATVAGALAVPAGGAARLTVPGLQRGTYPVLVDGRETGAVIRVADEG